MKLQESFEIHDPKNAKGYISKQNLISAFIYAKFPHTLTSKQWDQIIGAIEAWENRSDERVYYNRFLKALYDREVYSKYGIFEKVKQRELS